VKRARLHKRGRFAAVPLVGGVSLLVRPAKFEEYQQVAAEIAPSIAALIAGSDAAAALVPLLGDDFDVAEMTPARATGAGDKLALIELLLMCAGDIQGELIGTDDNTLPWPDKGTAALLLSDVAIARRLRAAIEASIHEEVAEGNG
jgi:hypothetical protein